MRTVPGSRCSGMAGSPARPIAHQAQLTKLCRLSKFLTVAKPVAKPQLRIGRARALTIDDAVRAMLPLMSTLVGADAPLKAAWYDSNFKDAGLKWFWFGAWRECGVASAFSPGQHVGYHECQD